MSKGRKGKRPVPRKKRGPGPVLAILLAGAVCCWLGLVKVDRQIRAVTINRSPPLWETRAAGDDLRVTVLGRRLTLDLAPVRRAGEELVLLLETPPAPARAARGLCAFLAELPQPQPRPRYSWKKGFL